MATAEALARQTIDQLLTAAGWAVQDTKQANIHAARGVALREFLLEDGHATTEIQAASCAGRPPLDLHHRDLTDSLLTPSI
jgi:hypothetical protein